MTMEKALTTTSQMMKVDSNEDDNGESTDDNESNDEGESNEDDNGENTDDNESNDEGDSNEMTMEKH